MTMTNKSLIKHKLSMEDRTLTEQWLKEMTLKGWILNDYKYVNFTIFTKYTFRKESPCKCLFKIIDIPKGYEKSAIVDEEDDGWALIRQRQNSAIFIDRTNESRNYSSDEETELALKKLQYQRLCRGIAKLIYIVAIIFILKEPIRAWRDLYLFMASILMLPVILGNFVYKESKYSDFKMRSKFITSFNLAMLFTAVFEGFYTVARFIIT